MKRVTAGSRVLLTLGMILSAVLLAACGGNNAVDPSASAPTPSSNESAQIPSSAASSSGDSGGVAPAPAPDSNPDTTGTTDTSSMSAPAPVQSSQTRAVTLSWQPPTENTDGTALTDLTGYLIQYGPQPEDYTNSIAVTNPGITTYVVENLPAGTYYFSISATAANGAQSAPSQEVMTTVD